MIKPALKNFKLGIRSLLWAHLILLVLGSPRLFSTIKETPFFVPKLSLTVCILIPFVFLCNVIPYFSALWLLGRRGAPFARLLFSIIAFNATSFGIYSLLHVPVALWGMSSALPFSMGLVIAAFSRRMFHRDAEEKSK